MKQPQTSTEWKIHGVMGVQSWCVVGYEGETGKSTEFSLLGHGLKKATVTKGTGLETVYKGRTDQTATQSLQAGNKPRKKSAKADVTRFTLETNTEVKLKIRFQP